MSEISNRSLCFHPVPILYPLEHSKDFNLSHLSSRLGSDEIGVTLADFFVKHVFTEFIDFAYLSVQKSDTIKFLFASYDERLHINHFLINSLYLANFMPKN